MEDQSFFGNETLRIIKGFNGESYDDPFEVRKLFTDEKKAVISFSSSLWSIMLQKFPCQKGYGIDKTEGCRRAPLCRKCNCRDELIMRMAGMTAEGTDPYENERRNLNNWLVNGKPPRNRDTYIKLCYALMLRVFPQNEHPEEYALNDAELFMVKVCGQAELYPGSPHELAHIYALSRPMGEKTPYSKCYNSVKNWKYAQKLAERLQAKGKNESLMTRMEIDEISDTYSLVKRAPYSAAEIQRYEKAKLLIKRFNDSFEVERILNTDILKSAGGECKRINREVARKMLYSYLDMDAEGVEKASPLSSVLYYSSVTRKIASGDAPMNRSVFLLTVLAESTLYRVNTDDRADIDEVDIDEIGSFSDFFKMINTMLRECNMAPLYPRRPFDFCILYAYYLFSREKNYTEALETFYKRAIIAMKGRCI